MQTDAPEIQELIKPHGDQIQPAEWVRIHQRRKLAGQVEAAGDESPRRPDNLIGLALSGGGIRSAIFNLGLLQGLHLYGVLRKVDYLSTVSGGGYIGASLTWFGSVLQRGFPYVAREQDGAEARAEARRRLQYLRAHGSYLVPGDGLNLWSLIAAIVAGSITTLAVMVPVFVVLVALLAMRIAPGVDTCAEPAANLAWAPACFNVFNVVMWAGIALLGLFAVGVLAYGVISSLSWKSKLRTASAQRTARRAFGLLLMYSFVLIVIGLLPVVYEFIRAHIHAWIGTAMSGVSIAGVFSLAAGLLGAKEGSEVKLGRSSLLSLGLLLAVFGIALWLYHLVHAHTPDILFEPALLGALLVSVLVAMFANINHVSMHRYYRNRLMEAFMPAPDADDNGGGTQAALPQDPDQCFLHKIPQNDFPYHLICANVQTVGSHQSRLRQRGGDSFLLSPEYCGSDATGYLPTAEYAGGSLNLATAMAISGAAADANTYATRSRPLVFLMTLFNVRLGYWIRNPRHTTPSDARWRTSRRSMSRNLAHWFKLRWRPVWYWYLIREVFGQGLDEHAWNIRLSDGGHFENLGLYELVRRRCKLIVVSDASRDPDFTFADFGRAVERVRADFGAIIDIGLAQLRPTAPGGESTLPYVVGSITYPPEGDLPREVGSVILVKSTQLQVVPPDVIAYKAAHAEFPDESTGDQFFDEEQFEAYRELGFASALAMCAGGQGAAQQGTDLPPGPLYALRPDATPTA